MSDERIRAEIEDLSKYLEGDLGHAVHFGIECTEGGPHCETPRHRGQQRTAVEYWVLTKYNYGEPLFLAMCQECHELAYRAIGEALDTRRVPCT